VIKVALKLLIVMAILVAVAGLCGGWKWTAKPTSTKSAAEYTLAPADANGSASSTPADTTITPAPADPNGSASSTPADTTFTPDGWTWD
jgi:cytoskeletal protein RodZ